MGRANGDTAMRQKKNDSATTSVPWSLLGLLCLFSLVPVLFYVTSPVPLQVSIPVTFVLSIFYPLVLSWLCFRGSGAHLWPSRSPPQAPQGSLRFSPAFVGMALLCYTAANVVFVVQVVVMGQSPVFPALHHYVYLGMYLFLIGAILLLPAHALSRLSRLRLVLDSLIILAAVTTLCSYFLLAPLLEKGDGTWQAKVVASAFPEADLILAFCLLLVALRSRTTVLRPVLLLLGGAVLGLFVYDTAHLSEMLSWQYRYISPSNATLFLSAVLLVGAAQTVRRILEKGETRRVLASLQEEQTSFLYPRERWKALLPSILVLLFGLLVFGIWVMGDRKSFPGQATIVYVGGMVVLLLMVARQFLTVHEIGTLQGVVQEKNRCLSQLNEQLKQQAISDPLTGLPNHQALADRLDEELARTQAKETTCALLFLDIDHFKFVNDQYGHEVGDRVLCQFGEVVESALRSTDYMGRWGGEEFVAVLPMTTLLEAWVVAERIRLWVEQEKFAYEGGSLCVTCSVGMALYPADATERKTLIILADAAMYEAKRQGRNQTCTTPNPHMLRLGMENSAPSD